MTGHPSALDAGPCWWDRCVEEGTHFLDATATNAAGQTIGPFTVRLCAFHHDLGSGGVDLPAASDQEAVPNTPR